MTAAAGSARAVLVAGCGYVGYALARLLIDEGDVVWGLRRSPSDLPEGVRPVAGDVTDPASLGDVPSHPDVIITFRYPTFREGYAGFIAAARG